VRHGEPVTVWLSEPLGSIHADGVLCDVPITAEAVLVDGFTGVWPLGGGFPTECTKGPPTTLRYEFRASTTLVAEFQWTGGNVAFDLEVPEGVVVATATPPAGPTPFPQSTITVRFVRDIGSYAVELHLDHVQVLAEGVDCTPPESPMLLHATEYGLSWPRRGDSLPVVCTRGPPTNLRIVFFEAGSLGGVAEVAAKDVVWLGEDIDTELAFPFQLGPGMSPFPSASPTQAPTAAVLPGAGGPPGEADGDSFLGTLVLLAMLSSLGALLMLGWSRLG
jgi:hypothetical protein